MKYASLGTVSHGTLRAEDLLSAFADTLEDLVQRNADEWCSDEGRAQRDRLVALIRDAHGIDPETDEAMIIVNEDLFDALETFAPPYCYFGAHEWDGSDFGFWPCIDQIDELPKIDDSDSDKARALGEDCAYVNDHGNVTVYGADGSVILELV